MLALAALLFPAAGAQAHPGRGADEAPAGITITGIGVAPTKAAAADRAVGDARQRAASIAAGLRVELGVVEGVYMPELTQFHPSALGCGGPRRKPASCRRAAAAIVTFGVVGGATAAEAGREIGSSGTAEVPVEPRDETSDRSIKQAIVKARGAALREAVATALRNAKVAAGAAGLKLGPLVSVAETPTGPYFPELFEVPSIRDPALGALAPGLFCGLVRRAVARRDRKTGRLKIVRVTRRRCIVPRTYETRLEIAYSAI
jgi:hypothetical protein